MIDPKSYAFEFQKEIIKEVQAALKNKSKGEYEIIIC